MAKNATSSINDIVMEHVISNVRDSFVSDGAGETALNELKSLWKTRMIQRVEVQDQVNPTHNLNIETPPPVNQVHGLIEVMSPPAKPLLGRANPIFYPNVGMPSPAILPVNRVHNLIEEKPQVAKPLSSHAYPIFDFNVGMPPPAILPVNRVHDLTEEMPPSAKREPGTVNPIHDLKVEVPTWSVLSGRVNPIPDLNVEMPTWSVFPDHMNPAHDLNIPIANLRDKINMDYFAEFASKKRKWGELPIANSSSSPSYYMLPRLDGIDNKFDSDPTNSSTALEDYNDITDTKTEHGVATNQNQNDNEVGGGEDKEILFNDDDENTNIVLAQFEKVKKNKQEGHLEMHL